MSRHDDLRRYDRSIWSRRTLLGAGSSLFASAFMPRMAAAAEVRDPRFVVIILRGALDGLSAVAPVGDPDYADLHGAIALSLSGNRPALPLDSFFSVNPAMPVFARLFQAKQAAVIHATATGYRERSHFDGQDVLESGMPGPGFVQSGWLNRALDLIPKGERVGTKGALAVGPARHRWFCAAALPSSAGRRKTCPMRAMISPRECSISTSIAIRNWPRPCRKALISTGSPIAKWAPA